VSDGQQHLFFQTPASVCGERVIWRTFRKATDDSWWLDFKCEPTMLVFVSGDVVVADVASRVSALSIQTVLVVVASRRAELPAEHLRQVALDDADDIATTAHRLGFELDRPFGVLIDEAERLVAASQPATVDGLLAWSRDGERQSPHRQGGTLTSAAPVTIIPRMIEPQTVHI